MNTIFLILIITAIIGSGVLAGLFFVFSNFAMKALDTLPAEHAIAAMQMINRKIINPWFLLLFLGTALCAVGLASLSLIHPNIPGRFWFLTGSLLHLIGSFFITIRFNVPLNEHLSTVHPERPESSNEWQSYLAHWMPWNHVRSVSTAAATLVLTVGLSRLGTASF